MNPIEQNRRIVICATDEIFGGVESFVISLAEFLVQHGTEVTVLLLNQGVIFDALARKGIEAKVLRRGSVFRQLRQVAVHMKNSPAAVWHVNGYQFGVLVGILNLALRRPVLKTEHGAPETAGSWWISLRFHTVLRLERLLTWFSARRISFVSADLMRTHPARGSNKSVVIYNGISDIPVARIRSASELVRFGIVGRLSKVKAHEVLLNALSGLDASVNWELWICGDGELAPALKELANSIGLQEKIKFLGFQEDMNRVYAELDVLVMPSYHEGLPFTLLEAMRAALPIVASDVGGMREVLVDRENAILVAPGDESSLTNALNNIASSAEMRAKIGHCARSEFEQKYTIEHMGRKFLELYEEMVCDKNKVPSLQDGQ